MPRATNAPASRERRKRVLDQAKGYRGRRSKLFRYAKDATMKGKYWAYRDRKTRKRNFRMLWVQRLNAAVRALGLTYSRFAEGLKAANIGLDRKVLSDLAISDEKAFGAIVERAPTNDFALFCLGRSLQLQGRHAEARKPLALASCLRPEREDYRAYLGRARRRAA